MSDEHLANGRKRSCLLRADKATTSSSIPTATRRAKLYRFPSVVSKWILVSFAIFPGPMISLAEEIVLHQPSAQCETIHDLDFEGCKPEQLGIDQLKLICDSIGLNVEDDVFPYLFDDEGSSRGRVYEQKDYVAAAYECLLVADETESRLDDVDDNFLREVLKESPEVLAQIVADLIDTNPGLIEELVTELKQSEPELWNAIEPETQKGRMELFRQTPIL